jgi:hypothetical protein
LTDAAALAARPQYHKAIVFIDWLLRNSLRYLRLELSFLLYFQVTNMTIAFLLRATGVAATLAATLLFAPPLSAQEQLTPPSDRSYARGAFVNNAPVGHRQPRAADVPQIERSAADLLEERQQAELNRRLRICRGC